MGRDKGKFNKRGGRGGGSRFQATSAAEIELRNERVANFDADRARRRAEAEEAEKGGGTEEIEQGVEGMNVGEGSELDGPAPMTRKQREEAERERKAAEYRKRHEAGLTEEYKRDMAKLAEVKKRREAAAKKAAAEKEETEKLEKERKALAEASGAFDDDSDDDAEGKKKSKKSKKKDSPKIPKLDKITIKKMKPTALKAALKERGLDIQGNAKTLTERLLKFELER